MNIKPWREIAKPHKDVLEGTFKQSEFAADISQVASGTATEEYQDPEKFFSRTFITEGMRLLLVSVVQRLAGQGGDPIIQLQTSFGGGKTHTMLVVYHLASRMVSTDKLAGIPPILDEAGITELPYAKVAVLDGIKYSPSQAIEHDGLKINTLWGELAWQLLGRTGYDKLAQSDRDGTSPGKEILVELLTEAAPCVILMDELVAFIRQFDEGKQFNAGSFGSNLSFVQALTEAMKSVPNAILLASLPESNLEVGGNMGQKALNSLEKYFARVESIWKPVATEEAFEIVRRRLFDTVGNTDDLDKVCKTFADFYHEHKDKFPADTQSNHYLERMRQSYPIHPEIFDRLYEDWSTLDKFQRTRGVLQYLAIVIHRLWNSDNKDALILPGSIPLDDSNVRNKSIHYLPQGWEPVIEKEIDGSRSEPFDIDGHDTRFGSIQAARRVTRTIFLGSAPSTGEQMIRGIKNDHILLGAIQPGQTIGIYEDVLRRLRDRLHYLYSEQDRYWFDTKPNLRREMESRKVNISEQNDITPLLKTRVGKIFSRSQSFAGVHIFTPSVDVPDEYSNGPRLVVLPPKSPFNRSNKDYNNEYGAILAASEILKKRGEQPRQKQNRLIFFAADYDVINRLKEQTRTYLAWDSILKDFQSDRLVYQSNQLAEVKRAVDVAEKTLQQLIREAYKWLICPVEEFVKGKPSLEWESVTVSPVAQNLTQEIENKLNEEEWLISEWSPIHLRNMLNQWYFKDGTTEVNALKVFHDCSHYLYLPRLLNDQVFKNTIVQGLATEDFFGFANAKEDDKYLGFTFGRNVSITLDESALLIERDEAADYKERSKPATKPETTDSHWTPNTNGVAEVSGVSSSDNTQTATQLGTGFQPEGNATSHQEPGDLNKKHFYGSIDLVDPVKAKMDFSEIVDEVVQQFTSKLGVNVKISVEIEAKSNNGFDESMQRTVKENCNVLGFNSAEFEDDD